ncbi:tRNA adenosine(34) deaminase TadA [Liberiplasma polymorphum]|uniref:tRNA adenosine(34) deaminase TadA n=1 Tax=Liberiplasma polymorphum TaxID=3374570 RepID=UPI0037747585
MKHEDYMQEAIVEAKKAFNQNEVPIGAIVVQDNVIIGRGYNSRITTNLATHHAELLAIENACKTIGKWRLDDATLYVTLEPCPMCAGAIIQSRISTVVYGTTDEKNGAHQSVLNVFEGNFNHNVEVIGGVLEEECQNILKSFFITLRNKKYGV